VSDEAIELRYHWMQARSGDILSDLKVVFYEVNADRQVCTVTVPNTQLQTIELARKKPPANNVTRVPRAFLSASHDERLDMFREALFREADQ
jgi:hypothetical protein